MFKNILLLLFITPLYNASAHGMGEANNSVIQHNWKIIAQELTPALLEILSKTNEPLSHWLKIFSPLAKEFLENLHAHGNLIHLIQHCFSSNFTPEEICKIFKKISENITEKLLKKRKEALKYLKLIKKNSVRREDTFMQENRLTYASRIKKYRDRLKDNDFINELSLSLVIDEKTGRTGLMLAIEIGDVQIFDLFLKYYLEQNCPLTARDNKRHDALKYAFDSNNEHFIKSICQALENEIRQPE